MRRIKNNLIYKPADVFKTQFGQLQLNGRINDAVLLLNSLPRSVSINKALIVLSKPNQLIMTFHFLNCNSALSSMQFVIFRLLIY